jgi:hypothetical protein
MCRALKFENAIDRQLPGQTKPFDVDRQAVDRGFRVIVVEDGLCSSSDKGHDALMTLYRTRFPEQ